MKENKFLVFSDLHFERKSEVQQEHLLSVINKRVDECIKTGFNPVVLLAGDINNSDLAYDWIKKINTQVYYTAGNHEFWENDFYEALDKLNKNAPANTKFLYNDFDVIDEKTIILGCTLWTDVGENIKPSLVAEAALSMNDGVYIRADKWYEDEKNVERLKNILEDYSFSRTEKSKRWNVLLEKEENQKSLDFMNGFAIVLKMMEQIEKKITNKSYEKKETIDSIKKIWKDLKSEDCTFDAYFQSLYMIKSEIPYNFISDSEFDFAKTESAFNIFKRLSKYNNFASFKIIMMTHHLPFYEEIIVGRSEYNPEGPHQTLGSFDYKLFLTREGVDYEKHNYLYRLMKGDFGSEESIFHIAHYFNNGHLKFSDELKKRVSVFVHGHHHGFNYQDYLKGKLVVCNTGANGFFHRYKYNGADVPQLTNSKRTEEEVHKEAIREFNLSSDLANRETKIMLWCLKNTDFTKLKDLVSLGLTVSKNYYKAVLKNVGEKMNENPELIVHHMALQKIMEDMGQIIVDFKLAMDVRVHEDFTMNKYFDFKAESKEKMGYEANSIEKILLGTSLHRKTIFDKSLDFESSYMVQAAFELHETFKIIHANALKVKDVLNLDHIGDIHTIEEKDVLACQAVLKKVRADKVFYEKICEKWNKEKLKRDSTKDMDSYRVSIY